MIYRIRIMRLENGKLVFDRYADKTEMQKLRVNADGKVEEYKLAIYKDIPPDGDVKADVFWFDVSATHFVEWGFEMNGKKYYENDKLESQIDETIYYNTNHQCFAIGMMWLEVCGSNGENETCYDVSNIYDGLNPNVIGNVWGSKWS